jgi:hypothetical protein
VPIADIIIAGCGLPIQQGLLFECASVGQVFAWITKNQGRLKEK